MVRRKPTKRKKRGAFGILLAVLLVLLLAAGAAGAWLLLVPFGPSKETFVEVTPGSSTIHIGQQLQNAGVVRNGYAFTAFTLSQRGTLKAGEYRFDHPIPMTEVFSRIARGDVYTIAVTIPEGSNVFDIASRLEQAGFGPRQTFLDAQAKETELVADFDPQAKSLEGYLFPDTYRFERKATPVVILTAMVRRFKSEATELGLKGNIHDTVTLASLVERETAIDTERPLVASVFENRLAKDMPLMTDPSVIYGLQLDGRWRGEIYASDLKLDTPYNTYLHPGLPPGPVANPGAKSLQAALQPAQSDYLYFVAAGADAQGKSLFSTTLEEHQHNVDAYRQAMKQAGGR
jgi:UPF0755 protein